MVIKLILVERIPSAFSLYDIKGNPSRETILFIPVRANKQTNKLVSFGGFSRLKT